MSWTSALYNKGIAVWSILCILAVSFTMHIAVALLSSNGIIQDDAISYREIATNLAHGDGFVFVPGAEPTAWRAPGYLLFLGAVFKLSHDSDSAARVANAFLWLGTTISATVIALLLMEAQAALLACALVAFYPEFIGLSGLLWSESLAIFLFVASLACLVVLGRLRRWPVAVLAGLLIGSCILTRSSFIVLPFLVAFAGFAGLLKRQHALAVALIALAVVAPWTVRNYRLMHRFVLVESNATMNLFAGSRAYAPIPFTFHVLKTMPDDPEYRAISRLSGPAQYTAFGKAARRDILASPGRFGLLALSKTFDFWLPDFFVARNVASGSYGPQYKKLWPAVLAATATAFLLISLGCILTVVEYRRVKVVQFAVLLLAAYTFPHAIVYGASRYHLPLMPVVCLCAAPALLRVLRRAGIAKPGVSEPIPVTA